MIVGWDGENHGCRPCNDVGGGMVNGQWRKRCEGWDGIGGWKSRVKTL